MNKSKTNYLNGITENYTYDTLYQLTQVTQGGSTTESYSYDSVGNRLSSLGVPLYSYNSSNELTSSTQGTYTYDANGNTSADARGNNYTWDFENRLTQAVVPGTNGGTTTFKYDAFGRRVQKAGPLGTTIFLYTGSNVIAELDANGTFVGRYTQSPEVDQALSRFRASTTAYFEGDGLGSITSLTDASSASATTYTYDALGNMSGSTGSLMNPFRYTGREFDSETGLYFYRARYYDSSVGRFISEDPLRFEISPNFYAYVENNPLGHIDPSGLCPCGYHKVRLYYTPNFGGTGYPDYHWYRQDSNGDWSSKHGWAPVGPQVNPDQDAASWGYSFCARMCAPDQNGEQPKYNPVPWNDPKHIRTNNCYSYACDRLHPPGPANKPQPNGGLPEGFSCMDVYNAAQRDGLKPDYDVPKAGERLQ